LVEFRALRTVSPVADGEGPHPHCNK